MKILHLPRRYTKDEWGGTETVLKKTIHALSLKGVSSEIWTSSALSKPGYEKADGIDISRFSYLYPVFGLTKKDKGSMDKIGGNLISFSLMKELFKRNDFDVYHLHTGKRLGSQAAFVAGLKKKPYIISLHGSHSTSQGAYAGDTRESGFGYFEWGKAFGAVLGSRTLLERANAIICVDPMEALSMREKQGFKNAVFLPNGVDENDFLHAKGARFREKYGFKSTDLLISCISRIDVQKNQLGLLTAFRKVFDSISSAQLLLIGPATSAEYVDQIKRKIDDFQLGNNVHIIGQLEHGTSDLADAYAASDIFALASVHEPFGIAVLEAWCAGKPVVASAVGGLNFLVEDKKNGLLVPKNNEEELAKALLFLAQNENVRLEYGLLGRKKALEQFSWTKVTKQLIDIYKQVQQGPISFWK